MKYVCKICGYIYNEAKEKLPFAELPDSWVCPLCGAKKSDFYVQDEEQETLVKSEHVEFDEDMLKLSSGQLSALFSNLARGSEKQYKPEVQKKFITLSNYFKNISGDSVFTFEEVKEKLQDDIEKGYENIKLVAGKEHDRGALRVTVWGEKVSRILKTLIERYEKEGEEFLEGKDIWVCTTCGFVYIGNEAPQLCPVCKVPDWQFEKIEGRA